MLKYALSFLFIFQCVFVCAQQLEDEIYTAVDTFISNQNQSSFKILQEKEIDFIAKISNKDEALALVYLQCNKAYYLKQINNSKEAIIAYENAWKRYSNKQLFGYDIIEYCLKPLGNLYTISKDYTNAENTIKQYIFLAEKEQNHSQEIAGIINLSILYQALGKHKEVLILTNNALKHSKIKNIQKQKLININTNSQIALDQITSTKEIPLATIDSYQYYITSSQLELKNGNLKKARNNFEKARKLFLKQENITARNLAKLYVYESQLFLKSDAIERAKKTLHKAIQVLLPNLKSENVSKEILYSENTFIDVFDLLGKLQNNNIDALKQYDFSFYVSSLLSENSTSQEAKILNKINDRNRSEKCIRLLFDAYSKTSDEQFLTTAFQYAERSKASVLKDIVRKKSLLQLHSNDSLLLKEQYFLQQQEAITNSLVNEQLNESRASVLNDFSKQLSTVSVQLRTLKKEISKIYPTTQKSQISFLELNAKLNQDTAVLATYFYGKEAIYQFVITANKKEFHRIELNTINRKKIVNFIRFFDNASAINNDIQNFTHSAFQTYNLLNLSKISNYKNLLIIPDGLLNFIPFEALLTDKTEVTKFEKMPFLVKKQSILYNSNTAFYLKKQRKHKGKKILGIFPVFEDTKRALIHSIDEAKAIKKEMNVALLMNEKATKKAFINALSEYPILHISTHASSGDFTIPASIDFYDEKMYLNELYSLNLDADLVVLSACETGVGKLQKGEGAMSIARGFQYAGAQNVLFSLWQINDKSTSQIMQLFYQNYSKYNSVNTANHLSKIEYLQDKSINNIKKSPYYWSAFVYYGELANPISQNYNLYIFIGLGVLLFLLFLVIKSVKNPPNLSN